MYGAVVFFVELLLQHLSDEEIISSVQLQFF
jgi:hypothetical protein